MSNIIPEGKYAAVARQHKLGETSNGKEQIGIMFEIIRGPQAGRNVLWRGFFTEKTWERTLESLRFCGWKGDDLSNIGELPYEVEIDVEHENYRDKTFARVAWVNRRGGVAMQNPLEGNALREFAAAMKRRAAQVQEVDGIIPDVSQAQSSSPESDGASDFAPDAPDDVPDFDDAPPPDDDIPF